VEIVYRILQLIYTGNGVSNLFRKTAYQILSESSEFCRRCYKKHFGLIFSRHSVESCSNWPHLYRKTASRSVYKPCRQLC